MAGGTPTLVAMRALALLPSPLLGPAVWRPVGDELAARGRSVLMPTAPAGAPRAPAEVSSWLAACLHEVDGAIAVSHSNAGLYVPSLRVSCALAGAVYVDALVAPSAGNVPVATPALVDQLLDRVDAEGTLPPWSQWWPAEDTKFLFPDQATKAAVQAEERRVPLDYIRAAIEVEAGWDLGFPSAYLAFGDTYAEELAIAVERGWPLRQVDGRHLHMLVDPAGVADEIEVLVEALGLDSARDSAHGQGDDTD